MKRIFTFLAASFLFSVAFAQATNKMSYQAVIRNNNNALLVNQTLGMQISILKGSSSGASVYTETQTPITNANGLVSIAIGTGTALSGPFSSIDWANGPYFIKTETDPAGGVNYSITGTNELMSVPYALFSANGTPGPQGLSGNDGAPGEKGDQGDIGEKGDTGLAGKDGKDGLPGDKGEKGDQGSQGLAGNDGTPGQKGDKGDVGEKGDIGLTGDKGDQGSQGLAGNDGAPGLKGDKGEKGDQGAQGPVGNEGAPGQKGDQGDKGEVGLKGSKGDKGDTPQIKITVSATGDTLKFENGGFVIIPGLSAANVPSSPYPAGSVFCASGETAIVEVTNPTTGKTWMDRNLGASQAATSSTDANSYGDFYQWGRRSDGHQCSSSVNITELSSLDQPTHDDFIISANAPYDWRSTQNPNLWQGVNGVNNPCPSAYRLPTFTELDAERLSWSKNNAEGAFNSPIKFPMAGRRFNNGGAVNFGEYGSYWTSSVTGTFSFFLAFESENAFMTDYYRAYGASIRCIKD